MQTLEQQFPHLAKQRQMIDDTADAIINILRHAEIYEHWEGILQEVEGGMRELEEENQRLIERDAEYEQRYEQHPDGNMNN